MSWIRKSAWNQGSFLNTCQLRELGIIDDSDDYFAIAISHSCDIANDDLDQEPGVEFILVNIIEKPDPNKEYAKNPRTLHIPIKHHEEPITGELQAKNKVTIDKNVLCDINPHSEMSLDRETKFILRNWLAARYTRHTLPDALDSRLDPVLAFLYAQGKRKARSLIGYWIDYEPFEEEISSDTSYQLWIYMVYSISYPDSQTQIKKLSDDLRNKFSDLIKKNKGKGHVDLMECEAYSEEEFTLSDIRGTIEYRLDNISLRLDPPGPLSSK